MKKLLLIIAIAVLLAGGMVVIYITLNSSKHRDEQSQESNNESNQEDSNVSDSDLEDSLNNFVEYKFSIWQISGEKADCEITVKAPKGGTVEVYEEKNVGISKKLAVDGAELIFGPAPHGPSSVPVLEYHHVTNSHIDNLFAVEKNDGWMYTTTLELEDDKCQMSVIPGYEAKAPCAGNIIISNNHAISVHANGNMDVADQIMESLSFTCETAE